MFQTIPGDNPGPNVFARDAEGDRTLGLTVPLKPPGTKGAYLTGDWA